MKESFEAEFGAQNQDVDTVETQKTESSENNIEAAIEKAQTQVIGDVLEIAHRHAGEQKESPTPTFEAKGRPFELTGPEYGGTCMAQTYVRGAQEVLAQIRDDDDNE